MVAEPRRQEIERLAIAVVVNGPASEAQAKGSDNMKFLTDQQGNEWDFYQERYLENFVFVEICFILILLPVIRWGIA